MNYYAFDNDIILENADCFNLALTLDCGQAFRWKKSENGVWSGAAFGKRLDISQTDGRIIFHNTDLSDFESVWLNYFDLDRDYALICNTLRADENLDRAINACFGIRILRQEPWETLCSFIISQNNNIPRIKGIIDRLCESFGEDIGGGFYSFPVPEIIASLTPDELAPIRAGFRAKYIIDAAQKVFLNEINLDGIKNLPDEQARDELLKIKGVGVKVAECTLLYGFNRINAFPVDVWVKRVMYGMYPGGLPECTENIRGIAQQYLFHYIRTS